VARATNAIAVEAHGVVEWLPPEAILFDVAGDQGRHHVGG
jgi:urease accessory protein UreH